MPLPTALDPLTRALAVLCLMLAALIALEVVWPFEVRGRAGVGSDKKWQAPVSGQDFRLPELESFADVIERPLFLKSRRPAPPKVGPEGVASAADGRLGQYALAGVVITPDERFVLLRATRDNKFHRVADGQDFEGWTVQAIEGEEVVFGREGAEERLPLLRKTPEKFKLAARRAALLGRRPPPKPPQANDQKPPAPGTAAPASTPTQAVPEG